MIIVDAGSVNFSVECDLNKLYRDLDQAFNTIKGFSHKATDLLNLQSRVNFDYDSLKKARERINNDFANTTVTPKINQKVVSEESVKAKKTIENNLNSVNVSGLTKTLSSIKFDPTIRSKNIIETSIKFDKKTIQNQLDLLRPTIVIGPKLGRITLGTDLRAITKEIMAGLAIGLSGVAGIGGSVGKGLIAGMKSALGIHSPATEAIKIMQQVVAGFAVGIKQANLASLFNPITLAMQVITKGSPFNQILLGMTNLLGLTAHTNRETASLLSLFTSIDPSIKLARTVGTLKILAQLGNSMIGVFNLGLTTPFGMANDILVTGLLPNMQTILALMGVVNRYTSQGLISPARLLDPVKALDILHKSLDAVGKQAPITFGLLEMGLNYSKLTHSISGVQMAYGLLRQELIGLQQELQLVGRMAIESAGSLAQGGGFRAGQTNAFNMLQMQEGVENLTKFRFDTSQFTKLNYLLGESKESVESVTQSFLKNSDDLVLPFDKLADGLNAMTKEGMSLNEIKSSFNEIANSATVSGIEIDKLVPAVVSVSQAFNQVDMGKLSAQLATASAIGGLGVDELSKGLLKLSPIINATGSDITDMMALLAGVNNATGRSQTDIARSIQLMNMNLAGAKATPLLQQLGVNPTDIRQATGELKPINDVITTLRTKVQQYQATGKSAVPLTQAIFGPGPIGTTIGQMIGVGQNSDLMASEIQKARAIISDGSASVNSALQKDSETLNASLAKLANATQAISVSVGKFFEPFLLIITNTALGVAQFFNGIDSSAKAFALTLKITIPLALLYYKSILSFVYAHKMAVASGELANVMMTKQNIVSALGTEIMKIKAMTMTGLSTAWSILTGKMTLAEIAQGAWNLSAKIGSANIAEFASTTGKANAIIGSHLKSMAKLGVTIGLLIGAWKVWASLFQRSEGYERAKSYEALNTELEKLRKNLYPEDKGGWDRLIDKANSFKSIIVSLLDDMKKVGAVEVLRNQVVGGFGTTSEQQNKTDPFGTEKQTNIIQDVARWGPLGALAGIGKGFVSGQQVGNQQAMIALGQVLDSEVNPAYANGIDLLARYNVNTLEQARNVKLSAGSLANFREQATSQISLQQGIIDKLKGVKTATEAEETVKQSAIRSAQSQINVIRAVIASQSAEVSAIQQVAMSLDDLLKKYAQLGKERMLVAMQNKAKFEEGLVGSVSTTKLTVSMDEISRDRALQSIEGLKGNISSAKSQMAELSVFISSSSGEELAKAQDEFDKVLKQSYQDRIQLAQELYKYELDLALENIKQIELARKNSLKQLTNNNELESANTDRKTSLQSITAEVSLMPLDKIKQDLEYKLQIAEITENDKAVEELKSQIYSQNLVIAQSKLKYDSESLELQIESRNIALDTAKINAEIAVAESQANLARAFANKESREVIDSLQIELAHRQKLVASAQANINNNNKIAELERRRLALSGQLGQEALKQAREVERLRDAKAKAKEQEKESLDIAKEKTKVEKIKTPKQPKEPRVTTPKEPKVNRLNGELLSATQLELKAMDRIDAVQDVINQKEQVSLDIIKAKLDLQLKYLESIKAIGDNAVPMFESTTNPELMLSVMQEQMTLQKEIDQVKIEGIQAQIEANLLNLEIDKQRELSALRRNEIEARGGILDAKQSLLDAQKENDNEGMTIARQQLSLANDNLSTVLEERKHTEDLFNQKKELLAIESKSNLLQEKMSQRAGKFADQQSKLNSVAKTYNNLLDQQQKQLESIYGLNKSIYDARLNALTQESGLLDKALELKSAISNADENTPKSLVVEQTKQLKVIGDGSEKKLLMDRLKLEQKMASEKMLALKAEQSMQKNLLLIELNKQKIQSQMAVLQAQVMAMSLQGTPQQDNANGLVRDAVKNQINTETMANNAMDSLGVKQAMESYNQAMENFKNINQQRINVATAGYTPDGALPQVPKIYDVPSLKQEQQYQPAQIGDSILKDVAQFLNTARAETSLGNIESSVNQILEKMGVNPPAEPTAPGKQSGGFTKVGVPGAEPSPNVTNNYGGITVISSDPTGDARKVLTDLAKANRNK